MDRGLVEVGDGLEVLQDFHRCQEALCDGLFSDLVQLGFSQLHHVAKEEGVLEIDDIDAA